MSKLITPISLADIMNSKAIQPAVKQQIAANEAIGAGHGVEYFNKPFNILSTATIKIAKADKLFGQVQAILYMAPADLVAVVTLCPGAKMAGCRADCLKDSGKLGMEAGQFAQMKRTIWYLVRPEEFKVAVILEIEKLYKKHGALLSVRLNGTSDVSWKEYRAALPSVQFYDYTKNPNILKEDNNTNTYDVTWSGSAYSRASLRRTFEAVKQGYRVAIAVNTKDVKGEWKAKQLVDGTTIIDFDTHDLRFNDSHNIIGLLSRKKSAVNSRNTLENSDTKTFFFKQRDLTKLLAFAGGLQHG